MDDNTVVEILSTSETDAESLASYDEPSKDIGTGAGGLPGKETKESTYESMGHQSNGEESRDESTNPSFGGSGSKTTTQLRGNSP